MGALVQVLGVILVVVGQKVVVVVVQEVSSFLLRLRSFCDWLHCFALGEAKKTQTDNIKISFYCFFSVYFVTEFL